MRQKGGSGGNGLPSKRLQMTHLCTTDLMSLLPPTIQYLARISVRVSLTPSCWTLKWASSAISVNSRWVLGKMIGSLSLRLSVGGADEGEEKSSWYLLHAHARIYRTFYRIIIRMLYQQRVNNYSSKIHYRYSLYLLRSIKGRYGTSYATCRLRLRRDLRGSGRLV